MFSPATGGLFEYSSSVALTFEFRVLGIGFACLAPRQFHLAGLMLGMSVSAPDRAGDKSYTKSEVGEYPPTYLKERGIARGPREILTLVLILRSLWKPWAFKVLCQPKTLMTRRRPNYLQDNWRRSPKAMSALASNIHALAASSSALKATVLSKQGCP